jgi:hypothetical protein
VTAAAPFLLPILLLIAGGFGLSAVLFGLRRGPAGWRVGRYLAVAGLVGGLVLAAMLVRFPDDTLGLVPRALGGGLVAGSWLGLDAAWSVPIALAAVVLGVLGAELMIVVLPAYAAAAWHRLTRRPATPPGRPGFVDGARAALGLATAAVLLGMATFTSGLLAAESAGQLEVVATYELPGTPTSVAPVDATTGYVTYAEGRIDHYRLPAEPDGTLELDTVVEGLTYPRGGVVVESELFVIDLGPLSCDPPYPQCSTPDPERELGDIAASAARVLAYRTAEDGALDASPRTVVDSIPVVNTEHAPGSLSLGADGFLYLTVGNIDALAPDPERAARIDHPRADWLGTVLRFSPDGGEPSTYVTGIRNIYQLAPGPDGTWFGTDNGGLAVRGYRAEEILALREGLDYGFPELGTFDPERDRETTPVTVLTAGGSAGLAWAPDVGLEDGLLIGTVGSILFVPLESDDRGPYVVLEHAARTELEGLTGFVSALEPLPDGRMLVAVFGGYAGLRNQLLLVSGT